MKKIFLLAASLIIYSLSVHAQKIDSVYYLLDTAKTPIRDRMWEIGIEVPFKYYTVLCPCLKYNNQLTFAHKIGETGKMYKNINLMRLTTLPDLISKAKKHVDNGFNGYTFFLIEHSGKSYVVYKVGIVPPKDNKPSIDYENIKKPR